MSVWKSAKARRVYAALLRIGWTVHKQVGSHRKLSRAGWPNFTFSFHDGEEVGPAGAGADRERDWAASGGSVKYAIVVERPEGAASRMAIAL